MTTISRFLIPWVLSNFLHLAGANPFAVAKKIQERPEEFNLGPIGEMAEAIIRGAGEIEEIHVDVGNPAVALNVLIVEPRDYGFNLTGITHKNEEGVRTARFSINISSKSLKEGDFARVLSPERQKELEEKGNVSFEPRPEEMIALVELTAREGGSEVETRSKTIFFLGGYGVSNRFALPWALILAKQGYRVVAPDLPGFARSGGKGPTYGKREAGDLTSLLTRLRETEKVGKPEAVGVIGVSYGAGMASLWAARDPRVTAAVLIAPYARADETISGAAEKLKDQLKLPFLVNRRSVRLGTELAAKMMGITWDAVAPVNAIPAIRHPILFVTSPSDEIIPSPVVKKLHRVAVKGSTLRSVNVPHPLLGLYLEELEPDILKYFEKTLP